MKFKKESLFFLKDLKQNNNRDWFSENKSIFIEAQSNAKELFDSIKEKLEEHDEIGKDKLFRIYRDVRFSKDKTPYKHHFAGSFSREGARLRGGYYLRIRPGESFAAGGFFKPEKEDLLRIRKEFELDDSEIRDILNNKKFKNYFGGKLEGDELKTAPKGFDKKHPSIDLIRKKAFIAIRNFSDEEVISDNFVAEVDKTFRILRPFFDFMSDVLTTDLNGESII